jgi:isopentenyl-diphosphate delta-isomerase
VPSSPDQSLEYTEPAEPGSVVVVHGPDEQVVLVDDAGRPIGVADKATVHGRQTPRHLAFSCYGFDAAGRLLVTQRALSKSTFPGVWTNTCCGHPAPGESLAAAAARRLEFELGLEVSDMRMVLPEFSYRASDGRIEENEFCPVLVCRIDGEPAPRSDEVEAATWWTWQQFLAAAADPTSGLSAWSRLQAPLLDAIGVLRP